MFKRTSPTAFSQEDGGGKSARLAEVSDSEFSTGLLPVNDGSKLSPPAMIRGVPVLSFYDFDPAAEMAQWQRWRETVSEKREVLRDRIDKAYLRSMQSLHELLIKLILAVLQTREKAIGHISSDLKNYLMVMNDSWNLLIEEWDEFISDDIEPSENNVNIFISCLNQVSIQLEDLGSRRPISAPAAGVRSAAPRHDRRARWERWNDYLENFPKNKNGSVAFSSVVVTLDKPTDLCEAMNYSQQVRDIPLDIEDSILNYLSRVRKSLRGRMNESYRVHFIAPILISVASLLDDVEIEIEAPMAGKAVRAHGRFEFLIRRHRKMIGIVEAKKDEIDRGIPQVLLGCEVAAETEGLDVVYGIVTNYTEWYFLKSSNSEVLQDKCSLSSPNADPDPLSLRKIAGKIYAILADD